LYNGIFYNTIEISFYWGCVVAGVTAAGAGAVVGLTAGAVVAAGVATAGTVAEVAGCAVAGVVAPLLTLFEVEAVDGEARVGGGVVVAGVEPWLFSLNAW